MIISIVAVVLGILMTLGGLAPNLANGMAQSRLDEALNHPEVLQVQIHPAAPSVSLLNGAVDYTEVYAERFTLSELPIDKMQLKIHHLNLDTEAERFRLREEAQGAVQIELTEAGLNHFLASETFKGILNDVKSKQSILNSLDADIQDVSIQLRNDGVSIQGTAATLGGFFTVPFTLEGQLRLKSERELVVQNVTGTTLGRPLPGDLLTTVLARINPIIDLNALGGKDMNLYFRRLKVSNNKLELLGEAHIRQLPQ